MQKAGVSMFRLCSLRSMMLGKATLLTPLWATDWSRIVRTDQQARRGRGRPVRRSGAPPTLEDDPGDIDLVTSFAIAGLGNDPPMVQDYRCTGRGDHGVDHGDGLDH